jgi:hypothetical protein
MELTPHFPALVFTPSNPPQKGMRLLHPTSVCSTRSFDTNVWKARDSPNVSAVRPPLIAQGQCRGVPQLQELKELQFLSLMRNYRIEDFELWEIDSISFGTNQLLWSLLAIFTIHYQSLIPSDPWIDESRQLHTHVVSGLDL